MRNEQTTARTAVAALPLRLLALVTLGFAIAFSAATAQAADYAGIVIDAKTGKTLYAHEADELRYPASLTKMMTLYLTFEAMQSGKIKLSSRVPISANAAKEPPTKLGLKPGQTISVEDAILSLITESANDVSTALGEYLGGSESKFASIMTAKARVLGMSHTTYRNAHGLPNSKQTTTARDQARLGIALREHFPREYRYFSTRSFTYGKRKHGNHNRLLGVVRGVDGIKTGYTRASGFNLVTSVLDRDRSIVAVVMGGRTGASRNAQMKDLISRYLPQASTRGAGQLIARGKMAPTVIATAIADLDLPKIGPLPENRHEDQRIALAYAAPAPSPVVGRAALAETLRLQKVAVPTPAPAYAPEPEDTAASQAVDPVITASTKSITGWVIQIGAMPDRNGALGLLSKAQNAGGRVLANAEPFTMAYSKGSEQLYRARFSGFDGQDGAVSACKTLKKKGFACWATQN